MTPDAGVDPTPSAPATAAALYDPSTILKVDLELPDAAWDLIRHQTPHALSILGDTCLMTPPQSAYTEVPADVELNGTRLENVALRKKGFVGSASTTKPSLKIKLDAYVAGQQLGGVDRLTLNNNIADPSQLRQCLGYRVIADAGLPAPRCALAWVSVNGEPLGLYTHLEPINRQFLRRHFNDDDGLLYEGTFSDFRAGWVETFEPKTSATDDRNALRAIALALERPDDELLDALADRVDVEQFFRFWALEVLIGHGDGYTRSANNFFVYRDPVAERFVFFPWGIDVILQPDSAFAFEMAPPPGVAWARTALPQRLYRLPAARAAYLAELEQLLDMHWQEEVLLAEVDRWEALISPLLADAPEGERALIASSTEEVRDFIRDRRETLEASIAAPPTWDEPLPASYCLEPVGGVELETDGDGLRLGLTLNDLVVGGAPVTAEATEGSVRLTVEGTSPRLAVVLTLPPAGIDALPPGAGRVVEAAADGTDVLLAELGGGPLSMTEGAITALSSLLYPAQ